MPRDLFSSSSSDSPSPKELSLVASPESQTPTFSAIAKGFDHGDSEDPQLEGEGPGWENEDGSSGGRTHFLIHHDDSMKGTAMQLLRGKGAQQANRADELHPLVQTLGLKDLESCLALEHACFEEHERASREKFIYRLTTAPELSLGLFSSVPPPNPPTQIPTYPHAHISDSSNPSQKLVLIGMIMATKTTTTVATDAAMSIPTSWKPPNPHHHHHQDQQQQQQQLQLQLESQQQPPSTSNPTGSSNASTGSPQPSGHAERGRTICIWSMCVLPSHQGKGLGKVLLKSYQQRMETSGIADRMAVLARGGGRLMGMYRRAGFVEKRNSEVKSAGGGWKDMVYEFRGKEESGLGY